MFTISTVELVLALVPDIVPAPLPYLEGCFVEMWATPIQSADEVLVQSCSG